MGYGRDGPGAQNAAGNPNTRMSAGPAQAYGLDTPRIAKGAPANLVLLDLEAGWRVGDGGFRSRSGNSWLLGETLHGRVLKTVADGAVVHG